MNWPTGVCLSKNRCDAVLSRDVYEPIDDVDYALDLDL